MPVNFAFALDGDLADGEMQRERRPVLATPLDLASDADDLGPTGGQVA